MPKIVDAFTFYNEIQLLSYRLHLLYDVVDVFIIVEANHTFMGTPKTSLFQEQVHLFEKFKSKIVHVIVDNLPCLPPDVSKGEQWLNEKHQRNCIDVGLQQLALDKEDFIVITDLDEIPDPRTLSLIKQGSIPVQFSILLMDLYYYNLCTQYEKKWFHAKIISYGHYKDLNKVCDTLRLTFDCPIIPRGGWHLSYFGSPSFVKHKTETTPHQEFNNAMTRDLSVIEERMKQGKDAYNRGVDPIHIPIVKNTYLPILFEVFLINFATPHIIN
jgi:beta-1,4-mannosyl-glycoprotein beta-1,4-N-acetylglucosaminyltransferase